MRRLAAAAAVAGALAAPALAHAATPSIARPDPVTYPVRLDYSSPLATLAPLGQASVAASRIDLASLAYLKTGDLGGFLPAPVGTIALASGGRDVLSPGTHESQIPLFAQWAGGAISSFTFARPPTGPTPTPDNGRGHGVRPPVPPMPGNVPPPANQGFGANGNGGGGGSSGGGTTTTTKRPPPSTTTTATTTTTTVPTTTTAAATVTTTTSGGGGGSGGGSTGCSGGSCSSGTCGTPGISITSSLPTCTISLTDAAPGDSVQETMTIQNTTGSPYTLSFKATGPNNNHLWGDLQMAVYDPSGGVPTPPYPPVTSWIGAFNTLTTLNPGQSVQYVILLYLPTTAGNADQGLSAVIGFVWHGG